MGNSNYRFIGFEDLQSLINGKENKKFLLINTMDIITQECLIHKTLSATIEESTINSLIYEQSSMMIIIYGKNSNDKTVFKRYIQLKKLGFSNLYIYLGGLFEWLLLQEVYGDDNFKTSIKELDILKYKTETETINA
jgi:hypothetical protein